MCMIDVSIAIPRTPMPDLPRPSTDVDEQLTLTSNQHVQKVVQLPGDCSLGQLPYQDS